jgi:hypothetical protein
MSTRHRMHCGAPSIDTASWITLRWTRGSRYFRVHLEQDLWAGWLGATCKVAVMSVQNKGGFVTRTCGSVRSSLATRARGVTLGSEAVVTMYPRPPGGDGLRKEPRALPAPRRSGTRLG